MIKALSLFTLCLLTGCATNSNGAIWAYADFNKYESNYLEFPTNRIQIGQTKNQVTKFLGTNFEVVEASANSETIMYKKWKSVPGPDYIDKKLFIRFKNAKLVNWNTTPGTTTVAPLGW